VTTHTPPRCPNDGATGWAVQSDLVAGPAAALSVAGAIPAGQGYPTPMGRQSVRVGTTLRTRVFA
jgi:molybdopterin biosynthesis enzyme